MTKHIEILVYYLNGLATIDAYNQSKENNPNEQFKHEFVQVSMMKKDCYLVDMPIDRLDNLELQIGLLNGNLVYIGCWDMDGSKTVFPEGKEYRNFNISLYTENLLPKEDGTFYTEEEARNVQVDFFDGWGKRDLS